MAQSRVIVIRYQHAVYSCRQIDGILFLQARPGIKTHVAERSDETAAVRWFGDHSLRRGRAQNLVAAAVRNEGPYANEKHPHRILNSQENKLTGILDHVL